MRTIVSAGGTHRAMVEPLTCSVNTRSAPAASRSRTWAPRFATCSAVLVRTCPMVADDLVKMRRNLVPDPEDAADWMLFRAEESAHVVTSPW